MAKLALCIGINDYPGTGSDLSGCVNDAQDWTAALKARGFSVSQLIDKQATRKAMLAGVQQLIAAGKTGDNLVITYSGHGTWQPDDSGDEPDGRDEALCPYDIDSEGALLDDDIHELFLQRAPGVRIILISDSCHSGSVTRGDDSDLDPGGPRARFLPPAAWMKRKPREDAPSQPRKLLSGFLQIGGDLLLAGCTDTQFSWDTSFQGRPNGAFTYYALKTLAQSPKSYNAWFKAIRDYLPSTRLPQNPQILGSKRMRGAAVFG
jgi:hypothetical protein